jgi:hypothetical protein
MSRLTLACVAVLAASLSTSAFAGDHFRGYSRPRDYGYYHGGGYSSRGYHSHSSFGFSFGIFTGPRYYGGFYDRPIYRPYYPPPVYYYDPVPVYIRPPVYVAPRVYVAPPRRYDYYYDDCDDYYYRPSSTLSFRYYFRR